jgi:hypothetical protein
MMIYLYALSDSPQGEVRPGPGIADQAVYRRPCGPISAWVSRLPQSVPPTTENVWRHEAIVETLMDLCTVLPARFGSLFADEEALESVLAAQCAVLCCDLERVRGRLELSLRVLWEPVDPPPATTLEAPLTGRDYLCLRMEEERRTREQRQRAEALAAQVHQPLARLAAMSCQQILLSPRLLLTAAYLVERGQTCAFEEQVEALRAAWPQLSLLCTGPWPAYSFMTTKVVADR